MQITVGAAVIGILFAVVYVVLLADGDRGPEGLSISLDRASVGGSRRQLL